MFIRKYVLGTSKMPELRRSVLLGGGREECGMNNSSVACACAQASRSTPTPRSAVTAQLGNLALSPAYSFKKNVRKKIG